MAQPAKSFDTIRPWDGSQSRAFEELSYQLLKDDVPTGTTAIRTGNPDGGVEWYVTLPDGREIGWQAKHTHGWSSLSSGMTDSVKRVAKERPNLRKLIFVLSDNLPTSRSGKNRKSTRDKYEDLREQWGTTIPGADQIQFEVIQGSDLLAKLAQPQHKGREWFWWDETVLEERWLRQQFRVQADAAGQKYRPDLQVDIPIQTELSALALSTHAQSHLDRLLKQLEDECLELHMPVEGDEAQRQLYRQIITTAGELQQAITRTARLAATLPSDIDNLRVSAEACSKAITAAVQRELQNRRERDRLETDDPARTSIGPTDLAAALHGRGLEEAVERLLTWVRGPQGTAMNSTAYWLQGQAGSGKTHLLLDTVKAALDEGRPAVFLSGAQFGDHLWASIAEQLGLANVGGDVLLDAMDAAGEASSTTGQRFVLCIDALNETSTSGFWRAHLHTLRGAVATRPHIALVVSCRDSYVDVVADEEERAHYLERTHPGFSGDEDAAAAKYLEHYKLAAPQMPLLDADFSVPLFLRIYCEAMQDTTEPTVGHSSRTRVFQRYLSLKLRAAARKLTPSAATTFELEDTEQQLHRGFESFVDGLIATKFEALPQEDAVQVIRAALSTGRADAVRTLSALQSEGLLSAEPVWFKDQGRISAVRITFQALSDFAILRRRMRGVATPAEDAAFIDWLRDEASPGVVEAAAATLPETHQLELLDLLGIDPSLLLDDYTNASWEARKPLERSRRAVLAFYSTLPQRPPSAVTDHTVDLLNSGLGWIRHRDLFRILFAMAPVPGHPLNAERLHNHLKPLALAERDAYFGLATEREVLDPDSSASRLARWAARGPYPTYDADVVELSAIPLCWLLSTPARPQRDWTTKALSTLLQGHLDVAERLVRRFARINDPYVAQRVLVAVYGALLNAEDPGDDEVRALAHTTIEAVFGPQPIADVLLLDAARGIVKIAAQRKLIPSASVDAIAGPIGLGAPRNNPPTETALEAAYGFQRDLPRDESWSSVWGSIFGMGDFGNYIVGSTADDFTTTKLGEPHPARPTREPRPMSRKAWNAFTNALSPEQNDTLGSIGPTQIFATFRIERRLNLTTEQRELLSAARASHRVVGTPTRTRARSDIAKRWVMARVVSLGWRPDLFAERDREISRWRAGRDAHKSERWGKKYQWIAFHEYVARIADNYRPRGEDELEVTRLRDIDPTLPPVPYKQLVPLDDDETDETSTWAAPSIDLQSWPTPPVNFRAYGGDIDAFTDDEPSEPELAAMTKVLDTQGETWIVLNGNLSQIDPAARQGWQGLHQDATITSWFTPAGSGAAAATALGSAALDDFIRLDHRHHGCCYTREIGSLVRPCPHQQAEWNDNEEQLNGIKLVATTESYTWSGRSLDCSIDESFDAVFPSTYLQLKSPAVLGPNGPGWADADGRIVYQHFWQPRATAYALLVRASYLTKLLSEQNLNLVVHSWYQRTSLTRTAGSGQRERIIGGEQTAWADSSLDFRTRPRQRLVTEI